MDPRRVLLVDDDEDIVRLLQLKLKTADISAEVAYSAQEALEKMSKSLHWVAVTDINMPGMSGVELLSALKRQSPLVQVIMLTGEASLDCVIDCVDRGAVDFFSKAAPWDDLVDAVTIAQTRAARWVSMLRRQTAKA